MSQTLKQYLQGALNELERLTTQIRETSAYNDENQIHFLLRELIVEQIGNNVENTCSTNHTTR